MHGAVQPRICNVGAARMVEGGFFPTLTSVAPLAGDVLFRVLRDEQRRQLLHDESAQTAVERGDRLIPAVRVKTGGQRLPTVQQMADTVDECIQAGGLHACQAGGLHAGLLPGSLAYSANMGYCT